MHGRWHPQGEGPRVSKAGINKGKGKGKHIFRTQLSVQDRVKRLAELKARSKCLRCGSTGHWAGDPICKFPSQGKKPPVKPQASKPGVGYMAISDEESSAGEYGVLHVRSRQEKEDSAFMAYRTQHPDVLQRYRLQQVDQPTQVISAWSVTPARTEHVGPMFQPLHREMKACLVGQTTSSRLANMLGCLTMRFCTSTLVIAYGESSRSHLVRVWQTFWIGPLTTDNYEIDGESHEVIPRMLPLEVASSVARSSHEKRIGSGTQMPPNPPCTRFTGLGSNAYIQVRTCLDCGHQARTKRVQVFTEPLETCRHQDLDKRGISKFTARLFCKQCGTFVHEMPQAEARRRRQLGQDTATLPSSAIDTTERVITAEKDDVCLDHAGAYHMMTIFQQDLDPELQSGEPVRAAVVYEILANAIEAV